MLSSNFWKVKGYEYKTTKDYILVEMVCVLTFDQSAWLRKFYRGDRMGKLCAFSNFSE